ncbi:MAG: CoA transferase [Dehalococcoidia bacterium]|nr:MAG: CoA transferase [Dehalococcoidia bacterium]
MLALEGLQILDITWQGPGPFCTMILGDLGAEIIKIGPPPTAGARQATKEAGKREVAYQATNRNKKSILLNLKSEEGRSIFHKLAKEADVIVEGFRPGVTKRLGIDYQTITEINPKIIYCSITGYGQDGPYRDLPGHDVNYISIGGVLNLIGEADRQPVVPLNLVADYGAGGMSAVVGILSALIARGKTGKGQYIDISLTDSVILLLTQVVLDHYFQSGVVPKRGEHYLSGAYPHYNIYEAKDGKFITIACLEPWLWENLCREIGREEFIPFSLTRGHLPNPTENEKWEEISSYLKQLFLTKTRDEWFELLSQKDVPIGKVYSLDEVFADPQVLHRKMVIEVEHPTEGKVKQVGIAIKLSDTPGKVRSLPSLAGEHTNEILISLGYSEQRISKLRQKGVIS